MNKQARKPEFKAPKPPSKPQPYIIQTRSQEQKRQAAEEWNSKLAKNEFTQRRLTFGKYVNVQIKDLPTEYITWGILNLKEYWAEHFSRELQRRLPEFRKC